MNKHEWTIPGEVIEDPRTRTDAAHQDRGEDEGRALELGD